MMPAHPLRPPCGLSDNNRQPASQTPWRTKEPVQHRSAFRGFFPFCGRSKTLMTLVCCFPIDWSAQLHRGS